MSSASAGVRAAAAASVSHSAQLAPSFSGAACSLDIIRMKLELELQETPMDERRTREYLHRTKLACSLVKSRRAVNAFAGNRAAQGTRQARSSSAMASLHGGGDAGEGDEAIETFRSDDQRESRRDELLGGLASQRTGVSSLSAPGTPKYHAPSHTAHEPPAQAPASPPPGEHSPRWQPAVTLAKDRRAIEQRAREEGGVEVAYKIPRGATWSQGLSTKPRAWTDFVLARPRRVWNWDSRLDHLRDRFQESTEADADRSALVDARAPEGRAARALATAAGQERAELAAVAAGLETRRDKADAARAAAREAACDAATAAFAAESRAVSVGKTVVFNLISSRTIFPSRSV